EGWEKWLRGHLDRERTTIIDAVGGTLEDVEEKLESKIRELELRLAEIGGGVNVLSTGRAMRVRGTFDATADYRAFDVVMLGGSSFVALRDAPGDCPGPGWQLLASCGRRGERGVAGPRGARGERGERG